MHIEKKYLHKTFVGGALKNLKKMHGRVCWGRIEQPGFELMLN